MEQRIEIVCPGCDGRQTETCLSCNGRGRSLFRGRPCPDCEATGLKTCGACAGLGYLLVNDEGWRPGERPVFENDRSRHETRIQRMRRELPELVRESWRDLWWQLRIGAVVVAVMILLEQILPREWFPWLP